MIAFERVAARQAPLVLASITCSWQAGVHAVVGGQSDGGALLLALAAGTARPRSGRVRVLDGDPADGAVRTRIAFVPREPALPDAMRVDEIFALADAIRGEKGDDPATRLAILGLASLARRPARSLSRAEARGVVLAEGLTAKRVRVLLVDEPLLAIDARALGDVPAALRARADAGCTVVVATGSARDAHELADDLLWLRNGVVAGRAPSVDALVGVPDQDARVRVLLRAPADAQALVAALAGVAGIDAIERQGVLVRVRGRDVSALARAAGVAAVDADVDVAELRVESVRGAALVDVRGAALSDVTRDAPQERP